MMPFQPECNVSVSALRSAVRSVVAPSVSDATSLRAFLQCGEEGDAALQERLSILYDKFCALILRLSDGAYDAWLSEHELAGKMGTLANARACAIYGEKVEYPTKRLHEARSESTNVELQRLEQALVNEERKADMLHKALERQTEAHDIAVCKLANIVSSLTAAADAAA